MRKNAKQALPLTVYPPSYNSSYKENVIFAQVDNVAGVYFGTIIFSAYGNDGTLLLTKEVSLIPTFQVPESKYKNHLPITITAESKEGQYRPASVSYP